MNNPKENGESQNTERTAYKSAFRAFLQSRLTTVTPEQEIEIFKKIGFGTTFRISNTNNKDHPFIDSQLQKAIQKANNQTEFVVETIDFEPTSVLLTKDTGSQRQTLLFDFETEHANVEIIKGFTALLIKATKENVTDPLRHESLNNYPQRPQEPLGLLW